MSGPGGSANPAPHHDRAVLCLQYPRFSAFLRSVNTRARCSRRPCLATQFRFVVFIFSSNNQSDHPGKPPVRDGSVILNAMSQAPVKVELEQGTPEWFLYRKQHFNASEAAAVTGCSPWVTRARLLELKRGDNTPLTNPAMAHGHRYEPEARKLAQRIFDAPDLAPAVYCRGRYLASLDAITHDLRLNVEIKCPVKGSRSDLWNKVRRGRLPMHYKVQLAHQWFVCRARRNLLMVYCHDSKQCVHLQLDEDELSRLWSDVVEPAWRSFQHQ